MSKKNKMMPPTRVGQLLKDYGMLGNFFLVIISTTSVVLVREGIVGES
jgi:hypothetical protein